MADKNNNHLRQSNRSPLIITGNSEILTKLSPKIFETYQKLAFERNINSYEITARPVSGVGDNLYGFILQICLTAQPTTSEEIELENDAKSKTFTSILKISPKNPAFRAHSRIADLYKREVFMYQEVFREFKNLKQERRWELKSSAKRNCDNESILNMCTFDVVPELIYANLDLDDEFIICEDLTLSGYIQNSRSNMPTYDLVCEAFCSIAKMHAMSFILQYRKPNVFKSLVSKMSDNLFVSDMEPLSVEFGKKYIRRTRKMLEQEPKPSAKQIEALEKLESNFKEICLKCVDGKTVAPYAVICHGDFWNNNILYKYNNQQQAISAKLIDFQLCRYASPILDLVHYLYTCTERELRSKHFMEFMNIYHETLTKHMQCYGHCVEEIFPKPIFLQHLRDFGIYGFCMAAFSIPFFISNTSEIPDFDEVATAIIEISSSENSDVEVDENENEMANVNSATNKRLELLEEYDLLSERTLPIFKRRMCGIVKDLEKYQMIDKVWKW